jgi:hypothetical protein
MTKRVFSVVILSLLLSTLALAQKINTDWDRSANFSTYHTYMWETSPRPAHGLWHQRIIDAIDKQLQAKGLTKVDSNPDMWVVYSNTIHDQKEVVGNNYGFGPGWGWGYWGPSQVLQHLRHQAGNAGGGTGRRQGQADLVARLRHRHDL